MDEQTGKAIEEMYGIKYAGLLMDAAGGLTSAVCMSASCVNPACMVFINISTGRAFAACSSRCALLIPKQPPLVIN